MLDKKFRWWMIPCVPFVALFIGPLLLTVCFVVGAAYLGEGIARTFNYFLGEEIF